jgi:fructose-1,6-bisphosphatase II / sedoheptulose-1,7-bisphosphatase
LGGHFQGRLVYDPAEVNTPESAKWTREGNLARLKEMGIEDGDKVYDANELACGKDVLFAGCGITPGTLMEGVRFFGGGCRTQSLVISTQSKTARFVDTIHLTGDAPKTINLR